MNVNKNFNIWRLLSYFPSYVYWLIGILLLLLIFKKAIISVFILIILLVIGSFSTFYRRFFGGFNIGIELITFFTIIICFAFNPVVGFISAALMSTVSGFLTARINATMFARIGIYMMICIMCAFMTNQDIITIGKIAVIVFNAALYPLYSLMYGFSPIGIIPVSINIIFNFILFNHFSYGLLNILQF